MKYKSYLALILMIGLFSFTACSGGDDPVPPDPDIDEGFTMDYYSDNGMYVVHPDGTAVPATQGDRLGIGTQQDPESKKRRQCIAGTPMEVSKSKDTLACIDSHGDGVSEELMILESSVGYTNVYNEDTWYNETTSLPLGTLEINGIDVSSCTTYDQMNSLLSSEGIKIIPFSGLGYIFTNEPMSVDVKYHEGTVVDHLYVDAYTPAFYTPEYEDEEELVITVPMKLTDNGYSIVDISSLPNGYYLYDFSQDLDVNCTLHIVD